MDTFGCLSDKFLLETYWKAVEVGVRQDFLDMILVEIKKRGISFQSNHADH